MKTFSEELLRKYREIDCAQILPLICEFSKKDSFFTPIKNNHTTCWFIKAGGKDYELLVTANKWFDRRAKVGGGGAIDLIMYLYNIDFKQAVTKLKRDL